MDNTLKVLNFVKARKFFKILFAEWKINIFLCQSSVIYVNLVDNILLKFELTAYDRTKHGYSPCHICILSVLTEFIVFPLKILRF